MASCAEQGLAEQKVTSYEAQGAPLVKKHFAMAEEGYGYIHIVNDEEEATFTEVVNYTKFDKLTLLKPFKGQGYSVTVKPGERRTVVIRQDDPLGFSLASQIMQSSFALGGKKMIDLCKNGAGSKKTQRLDTRTKEPYEIYQY